MDDESGGWKDASGGLILIGLGACFAAVITTGLLALIACGVALACLVGSLAVSIFPAESPCERYLRECNDFQPLAAAEPAVSHSQEPGQSHHWRQSVIASRKSGRSR